MDKSWDNVIKLVIMDAVANEKVIAVIGILFMAVVLEETIDGLRGRIREI